MVCLIMTNREKRGEKEVQRCSECKRRLWFVKHAKTVMLLGLVYARNNAVNIIIIIIETAFKQLIRNLIIDTHRHNAGIL